MQYVRAVDFAAFPPAFHSQRLADSSSGLDSCVCLCTRVPPGTGTTAGRHVHPCDQLYYVLSGTMSAEIGGQMYSVEPNTLVVIPAGVPHWNWNDGPDDEVHFEVLVPAPAAGQATLTPVGEDARTPPTTATTQVLRPLNEALFETDRFSEVVLADRASGLASLSMSIFRVPSGGEGPKLHVHRFDQIYFVTRGTMHLEIGLNRYVAGPNTLVTIPAGMPHRNWNAGSDAEYHLNMRVPEPAGHDVAWDLPVTIATADTVG